MCTSQPHLKKFFLFRNTYLSLDGPHVRYFIDTPNDPLLYPISVCLARKDMAWKLPIIAR